MGFCLSKNEFVEGEDATQGAKETVNVTQDMPEYSTLHPTQNPLYSTQYPLKGRKIQRITRQDIEIFIISQHCYEVKIFNNDNIIQINKKLKGSSMTFVSERSGLYNRVFKASGKIFYKRSTNEIPLNKTIEEYHENDYARLIKHLNNEIDYVEKYAEFRKKDVNTLL